MTYRLRPNLPLAQTLRDTARSELTRALRDLDTLPQEEAVHQLRKRCKKMRALLRLVRAQIGDAYRYENAHYRTLANTLAGSRDAVSMRDALLKLAPHGEFAQVLAFLETRVDHRGDDEALEQARSLLLQGQGRIEQWPLERLEWRHARKGYQRGYKRARKAMQEAFAQESAASFHEYRKRVKDHWYHSRLLSRAWKKAGKRRNDLNKLAKSLGDWHDLQLLRHLLVLQGEHFAGELIPLLDSADRRLHGLRGDIETLSYRLFADRKLRPGKRRS